MTPSPSCASAAVAQHVGPASVFELVEHFLGAPTDEAAYDLVMPYL